MEQAQIQKLKINATNIKNSLTGYNKQLIKLRRDEFRFAFTEDKRKKLRKKEEKLESKTPIQQPQDVIKSKILAGPMSFFDKVKEFFGIVFLGLLINNLPKIINGLKKFFTDNKWIIDAVKLTIKLLGDGIMGMIWLVTEYPKAVQKSMMNELEWAKKEFERVGDILDNAYKVWSNFYNPSPSPTSSSSPSTSQGSQGTQSYQPTNSSGSSSSPPQKFSRGGTVKPSRSKPAEKQTTKSTITGTFRGATPTPMGKKAIESTNSFETFATVAEQVKEHSILLDGKGGINENFTDVNESFSQFLINLKDKEDKDKKPPTSKITPGTRRTPPSPGTSTPGGVNAPSGVKVDPSDILGAIGSTGRSTGPHLHIETGDGSGGAGGIVPKNILDNVFINGVPLSRLKQGDGLGAGRNHKGFDYPANSGSSLTIGGNLKFVEYDEGYNAGYGNSLIIMDENGNKYLLGHLSSGPTQSALKKIKEKQKPQVKPQQVSRKIGQSPEDSLLAMGGGIDLFVTQVVEKPVPFPMPMPVRVNSNSESSNNVIPEINPLLLV